MSSKLDKMEFNDIEWHDSIIQNIIVDHATPGKNDIIQIEMMWLDKTCNTVVFKNLYWANLDLNFGIISSESVHGAFSEGKNNEDVKNVYLKWKGYIDDIDLNYYEIETNSTASKIKIIAQGVELE